MKQNWNNFIAPLYHEEHERLINSSENIASATINDEEIDLGSCGWNTSYTNAIRLEFGVNWFSLVVTDYAGNSSYKTFSVERLS